MTVKHVGWLLVGTAAAAAAAAGTAAVTYAAGERAFWSGDFVSSELAFFETLIADENNAGAHYYLGRIYDGRNSPERALGHLEKAAGPEFPEAYFWIGSVHYGLADYDAAAAAYKRYLEFYKNDAAGWYNLGVAEAKMGRGADAENDYLASLAANPRYLPPLFNLAVLYHERRDYERAAFYWRRALDIEPRNPEAFFGLGLSLAATGDALSAADAFVAGSALSPLDKRFFYELGNQYFILGRYELAIGAYTRAYELGYDEGRVAEGLGLTYAAWKRYDSALPFLTRAAETRGKNAGVAFAALGRIEREQGRTGAALVNFFEAAARLGDAAEVYNEIGEIYLNEDLATWAIDPLRKAVAGDPRNARYNYNLALAHDRSSPRTAAAYWRRYLTIAVGLDEETARIEDARLRLAELEALYGQGEKP